VNLPFAIRPRQVDLRRDPGVGPSVESTACPAAFLTASPPMKAAVAALLKRTNNNVVGPDFAMNTNGPGETPTGSPGRFSPAVPGLDDEHAPMPAIQLPLGESQSRSGRRQSTHRTQAKPPPWKPFLLHSQPNPSSAMWCPPRGPVRNAVRTSTCDRRFFFAASCRSAPLPSVNDLRSGETTRPGGETPARYCWVRDA